MSVTSDVIEDDKGQQILLVGVQSDGTPTKLLCDSNGKLKISTTGGGGSGTVTSIATSSPITGGTITSTGTIGISAATTSAAGSMSSADKTKLDGIEANADVTDSANVTAAGALMDSEVTNLAFVKGLTGGISDGNVLTANNAVADNDFLRIDGTEVEGLTAAEVRSAINVEDGATADQSAADIRGLGFFDTSNDGASSGLDADLLDGQHGSYYLDFGNFVIDNDEIPIAKLAEDAVTVTAGDGLKNGGSVTLGSSVTLNIDVSDFAGTGLKDEGSENLGIDFSDSTFSTLGAILEAKLGKISCCFLVNCMILSGIEAGGSSALISASS